MTPTPRTSRLRRPGRRGFTLIELLVAVAIGAMMMLAAIPAIRGARKPPSVQALTMLLDSFREARARAVLTGRPARVLFQDAGASLTVEPAPDLRPDGSGNFRLSPAPPAGPPDAPEPAAEETPSADAAAVQWSKTHFPDDVAFRRLTINLQDKMQATSASVRFYPNGTCDLFDAELAWQQSREVFHISLDVITGVPVVEGVR